MSLDALFYLTSPWAVAACALVTVTVAVWAWRRRVAT
jgi:hypothetical protein